VLPTKPPLPFSTATVFLFRTHGTWHHGGHSFGHKTDTTTEIKNLDRFALVRPFLSTLPPLPTPTVL
jgi:hypothetical protein